jgi:chromosome partitioning protein
MSTEVVAIVSRKGGVGKTTSAVGLAAALAEQGRQVLLMDLDPQASASVSLGVDKRQLSPSAADLLLRDATASEVIRASETPRLDLVTSSIDLQAYEAETRYVSDQETVLRAKLAAIEGRYEVVVIDCPPALNLLSRNALAACTSYIVPVVPHFLAIEGIQATISAAERLRQRCAGRGRLLGILPTMVDYRTKLTRESLGEIRSTFGSDVFAVEIRTNVRLAEAPAAGQTILEYDGSSSGAGSYRLAAEELLLRLASLRRRFPLEEAQTIGSGEGGS